MQGIIAFRASRCRCLLCPFIAQYPHAFSVQNVVPEYELRTANMLYVSHELDMVPQFGEDLANSFYATAEVGFILHHRLCLVILHLLLRTSLLWSIMIIYFVTLYY